MTLTVLNNEHDWSGIDWTRATEDCLFNQSNNVYVYPPRDCLLIAIVLGALAQSGMAAWNIGAGMADTIGRLKYFVKHHQP